MHFTAQLEKINLRVLPLQSSHRILIREGSLVNQEVAVFARLHQLLARRGITGEHKVPAVEMTEVEPKRVLLVNDSGED